jgi:hypothetical protein
MNNWHVTLQSVERRDTNNEIRIRVIRPTEAVVLIQTIRDLPAASFDCRAHVSQNERAHQHVRCLVQAIGQDRSAPRCPSFATEITLVWARILQRVRSGLCASADILIAIDE